MAMFKVHVSASSVLGVGYCGAGYLMYNAPLPAALVAGGFCAVSGMLPDIDSGPGKPLREITTYMASVVPMMLLNRFLSLGMTQEMIILMGAILYVAIRFGLATFMRHYTIHRGMFHSFPAMAIFVELTYLMMYGESTAVRCYMAGGVALGFLSHLILDEIYSVDWQGKPRIKCTFGTAMKFVGEGWWPNITAYAKLIIVTALVIKDPSVFQHIGKTPTDQLAKSVKDGLKQLPNVIPGVRDVNSPAGPITVPGDAVQQPAAQSQYPQAQNPRGQYQQSQYPQGQYPQAQYPQAQYPAVQNGAAPTQGGMRPIDFNSQDSQRAARGPLDRYQ